MLASCAGVASDYRPMIDHSRSGSANYDTDLAQCQTYAGEHAGTGEGAAVGAVLGGLFMALLAPRGYGNNWAATGMALGGVTGAGDNARTQREIIKSCLRGRGYSVLN